MDCFGTSLGVCTALNPTWDLGTEEKVQAYVEPASVYILKLFL